MHQLQWHLPGLTRIFFDARELTAHHEADIAYFADAASFDGTFIRGHRHGDGRLGTCWLLML